MTTSRYKSALKASGVHFLASLLVALLVGALVFLVWYPHPYRAMSGGTELFFLVMGVDIVCGPLLTLVLFNPAKPRRELFVDLGLVVVVQLAALGYGLWTVHQARPLYLVHEVDRFKVIALADIHASAESEQELAKLPQALQPQLFTGPQPVGLREASKEEREKVMFESVQGGRDYGERPAFYVAYDAAQAAKAYAKAKPLDGFVKKFPAKQAAVQADITQLQTTSGAGAGAGSDLTQWRFLPVMARQDWVAVLNAQGQIVGYLRGDGF
jgi:hypothetical protein